MCRAPRFLYQMLKLWILSSTHGIKVPTLQVHKMQDLIESDNGKVPRTIIQYVMFGPKMPILSDFLHVGKMANSTTLGIHLFIRHGSDLSPRNSFKYTGLLQWTSELTKEQLILLAQCQYYCWHHAKYSSLVISDHSSQRIQLDM